jgi:putative ABC transport system ATP-binding protein
MTPNPTLPPAVRTGRLCRRFQMGTSVVRAVDGISVEIAAKDFVALLGPSGSGKSSLLNLFAGLDRPTGGSVEIHGKDLARLSRDELAGYRLRTAGMVFQSFNLIPTMTVVENVELPMCFAEVDRAERASLARAADVTGTGVIALVSCAVIPHLAAGRSR